MKHRKSLSFRINNHERNKWRRRIIESDNKLELKNSLFYRSFFYAAERFDVRIMSMFVKDTRSLVFCGFKMTEEMFLQQMDTAPDYKVIGYRKVELDEVITTGWFPSFMEGFNSPVFIKERLNNEIKQPFAYYAVYDLKKQLPKDYGYNRFRLFYICGEPVSTYRALYSSNKSYPEFLARIYNKHYSNFELLTGENDSLHNAVLNNPYGKPKVVLFGCCDNTRSSHDLPLWKEYILNSEFMTRHGIHKDDNIVVWKIKPPI